MAMARLLAPLAVVAAVHAIEEVPDARDLTFKIKTNDAVVVGMFSSSGSAEEKLYRQVASGMEGNGVMFAVSYDAKVAKKYLDGGPPSVAVFKNFDPETGHSKKVTSCDVRLASLSLSRVTSCCASRAARQRKGFHE